MSYETYSKEELEEMVRENNNALKNPYEQDKWVEREQNQEIEDELRRRK